jgi:hypothetical protein
MFRFTIRDVLWLTVVVGLFISWVHERYALEGMRASRQAAVAESENLRGQVSALDAMLHQSSQPAHKSN